MGEHFPEEDEALPLPHGIIRAFRHPIKYFKERRREDGIEEFFEELVKVNDGRPGADKPADRDGGSFTI